jgi:hypothetical protein
MYIILTNTVIFFCLFQDILLQPYRMHLGLFYDKVNAALLNSILYTKPLPSYNCMYMYNWLLKVNPLKTQIHFIPQREHSSSPL